MLQQGKSLLISESPNLGTIPFTPRLSHLGARKAGPWSEGHQGAGPAQPPCSRILRGVSPLLG